MRWSLPSGLGLRRFRRAAGIASAATQSPRMNPPALPASRGGIGMVQISDFGSNPGQLRMLAYVPEIAPTAGAPLLVLLHGCGQTAREFARDAGWVALAERLRLPLVLPEQTEQNNRNLCFNWFHQGDAVRGRGEALSIRQMVAEAIRRFASDPKRVYVVGLSAGGAMAAALLAAYPEVFAAGATVAGLPVGSARNATQAFACMSSAETGRTAAEWAARARAAGPENYRGQWPRISIWHGAQDRAVDPRNSENLVAQWTALHGIKAAAARESSIAPGARRRVWGAPDRPVVESWVIETLAHGFPLGRGRAPELAPHAGADVQSLLSQWNGIASLGQAWPLAGSQGSRWVQEVGIDAAEAITRFCAIA